MNKHFESIIERIKNIKGLHTDAQVAKALGITKNNLYASKTRDSLLLKHLHGFCLKENIRLDYLLTGTPPVQEPDAQKIAEPQEKYHPAKLRRVTDNPELKISELIQKTVRILESNTAHKIAMAQMINICYQSVLAEEKITGQENIIKKLEDELKALSGGLPPAASG